MKNTHSAQSKQIEQNTANIHSNKKHEQFTIHIDLNGLDDKKK